MLPAVKEYQGQDVNILFCDDDKVYDPDWAQRFLDASTEHPNHCILEEGGVLVRPSFFTDVAFDIPDILWTVDSASLHKLVHEGHGRTEANQACVDNFREHHQIWR